MKNINSRDNCEFVGINNRMVCPHESRYELSVRIIKGRARVGDRCKICTDNGWSVKGLAEAQIIAIRTADGFTLEASADTETLMTFANLPTGVTIPYKGIISTHGYTMEGYASLPFEMITYDLFNAPDRTLIVTGMIYQGTIHINDRILISNENLKYSAFVEEIEKFKKFHEKMSYGEVCGLFLYNVPEYIKQNITKGSIITRI